MKVCLPLMKNVLTSIDENVSVVLVLTVAVSATDATTQNKILELGITTLIISNKELQDIMKIVKSLVLFID